MLQESASLDMEVDLARAFREDASRLWSRRQYAELETSYMLRAVSEPVSHVQVSSDDKAELVSSTSQEEDMIETEKTPTTSHVATEALVPTLEGSTEKVEAATLLRNEATKLLRCKEASNMEASYHIHLATTCSMTEHDHSPSSENSSHELLENAIHEDNSHELLENVVHEDVESDSDDDSFHSLEEFAAMESTEQLMFDEMDGRYSSTAVQTDTSQFSDGEVQTEQLDTVCLQDAETNTVVMTTSDTCTNTVAIETDDAVTNTDVVTEDAMTNTVAMTTADIAINAITTMEDVATNTVTKDTVDAIVQTDKKLFSQSQTEYETVINKYKNYVEAVKAEVTQEKSQRLVAEQMATIVQSELAELRQRNVDLTSQQIRLENELSELKVEHIQSQKMLKDRDQKITELNDSLSGTSLLVKKLEEQSTQVLMGRGGIDYMLEAKLSSGRALEAEQKVEVLQAELLQSRSEVKSLLDKISELTREKSETVSHVVHMQLMQIADERALQAETKCRQLENEVLSLKRQLQAGGTTPSSLLTTSLTTNTYEYSSLTTPRYGYSSTTYPSSSSSLYSSSSSYGLGSHSTGNFKLSESATSHSQGYTNGSYGYKLPTTTATGLSFGYKYQSDVGSTSLSSSDTNKPVTVDTRVKDDTKHVTPAKEASLVLPALVDSTPPQTLHNTVASQESGDSSDWSSSDEGEDPYTGSDLRPSPLANRTAQWEWRAQEESQPYHATSQQHVLPRLPVKSGPPVAPKPQRTKGINRSHSTPAGFIPHEEPSSFTEPVRAPNLKNTMSNFARAKGPKGRTLPQRHKNTDHEEPRIVTVPEI